MIISTKYKALSKKLGPSVVLNNWNNNSYVYDPVLTMCRTNNSGSNFKQYWNISNFPCAELDVDHLCNRKNKDILVNNIKIRKGVGDIEQVYALYHELSVQSNETQKRKIKDILMTEMLKIPNKTHPEIITYGENPKVLTFVGDKLSFNFKPKLFHDIAKAANLLRNNVSNFTGHKSYFFVNQLAELEYALIKYSITKLVNLGFKIISVPDILHRSTIERCGMETQGSRSQVYSLNSLYHGDDKCLSGTAEMALAAYLMNTELRAEQLPLRLAAVSRCFRAETSRSAEEAGIFRVHQFTKVEMFGVTKPQESGELLDEFRKFQEDHFSSLGLHLRVLDMPPHELGAQAYRKYDVEAWLPGKGTWAEVSSCSDCTDYQSRRLGVRLGERHVYTINGTACAVPRLIIALFETHQQSNGSVLIPSPLRPLMGNATHIYKDTPQLRPIKRQMLNS